MADPEGKNLQDAQEVRERIEATGAKAALYQADIGSSGQVEEITRKIVSDHGRLDGIVNNAGILRNRSVRKMTREEWQSVIDVNLTPGHSTAVSMPER